MIYTYVAVNFTITLCANIYTVPSYWSFGLQPPWEVLVPQPNKTKPPLQVAEGNSEKNKVWDETHDGVIINHIKQNLSTRIRHCFFLISYQHLVWSLTAAFLIVPHLPIFLCHYRRNSLILLSTTFITTSVLFLLVALHPSNGSHPADSTCFQRSLWLPIESRRCCTFLNHILLASHCSCEIL